VTSLPRDTAVRVDYRVRRRKYADTAVLIRNTDFVEIDDVTDTIWLTVEQGATVAGVITALVDRHDLPLGEAMAAAVATLEHLRGIGFVVYDPPT
jgi:hypothetical protein